MLKARGATRKKSNTKSFTMEIFDTSTDIYRPLSNYEIADMIHIGVEQFAKDLAINLWISDTVFVKGGGNSYSVNYEDRLDKWSRFF